MLDGAAFFAKFKGKGLLYPTIWTPKGGGAGSTFEARLMKGGMDQMGMLDGTQLSVQFITADAPLANQGDTLTINGDSYLMRERDGERCSADGTLVAYLIRKAL